MAEAGDDDAPSPQAEDFRVEPLNRSHARKAFDCGVDTLNRYLQTQARQDAKRYAAASFVAVHARTPERIVGYYTLAPTGIDLSDVPDETARTLPRYPIVPAILIGRLAVDRGFRSCGYGEALLMDAMDRALSKASEIGGAALIVDAKDAATAQFYERFGFQRFPERRDRLFLPMTVVEKLFR